MIEDLEQIISYMEVTHPENTFIINKLKNVYEKINANTIQQTDRREVVHAIRWKAPIVRTEVQALNVGE